MSCNSCIKEPVISRRYSGEKLCKFCFFRSVEKNVAREIKKQLETLVSNSKTKMRKFGVGLSGGKDSTVLLYILKDYCDKRDIKLLGLSVDEGIEGYRNKSLEIVQKNCSNINIPIKVFSYNELIGMTLDEFLTKKPPEASPCSPCGILRRRTLNQMANESKVDCMALGHNLDDFAQTVLMNHSRGDISRLIRMAPHRFVQKGFIPRILPLRKIPEQEVYLYALLKKMKFHDGDCPYASKAQRNIFRMLLLELESKQPGTRHALLKGMEKIRENNVQQNILTNCTECKEPSGSSEICVFCKNFGKNNL